MPSNNFNRLRKSAFVNTLFSAVISNLILFAQPLELAILKQRTPKYTLPKDLPYQHNTVSDLQKLSKAEHILKTKVVKTPKIENVSYYYSPQKSGVIGKQFEAEGENPYDNFFSITLPSDIDLSLYKATMIYDLFGVKKAWQTTKSVNSNPAYGGLLIEESDEWSLVEEVIPSVQLKNGENEIYFNRRTDTTYQYEIKNLRIELKKINNLHDFYESGIKRNGNDYYIYGYAANPNISEVKIFDKTITLNSSVCEYIIKNLPDDINEIPVTYTTNANEKKQINIKVEEYPSTQSFENYNYNDIDNYKNITDSPILYQHLCLDVCENELYEDIEGRITITGLLFKDIRVLNDEINNVTAGRYEGYRVKHDGKPLKLHLKYDESEIPTGYTAKDIRTFYFDKQQKSWKSLPLDSLDYLNKEIISTISGGGDTDYINGVIKMPESPEVGSFAPTMMADMKYADPASGVVSIAPPTPNNNGTVTTGFPIKLPQGRVGMQPSLQVSYNSEAGNGWMGVGWNLAVPSISINTKWGVPRFDSQHETEIYALAGSDLVLKEDADYTNPHRTQNILRASERRFYERKEGGYNLIIRHGNDPSNYWWEVTDKFGNKSFYGGWYNNGQYQVNANSVIRAANNNITHWALKATLDTNGNYVLYEYYNNSSTPFSGSSLQAKEFYLQNIKYTLFNPQNALTGQNYYLVDFIRNDYSDNSSVSRDDVSINGRNGVFQIVDDLLTEIQVSYHESGQTASRIRSYRFLYEEKAFKKQQLVSISEYDSNNSLFYTNTIEYYDYDTTNASIINSNSTNYGSNANDDVASTLFDLAGNFANMPQGSALGTSESSGFSLGVRLGGGIGANASSVNSTIGGGYSYSQSNQETKISFLDINGDGLPDKVYKNGDGIFYKPNFQTNNQTNWGPPVPISSISSLSKTKSWTNGFSGDANAAGFGVGLSSSKTNTVTDNYFTDFNGDGLPDMVRGNRVHFNKSLPENSNQIMFNTDPANTENPIVPGQVSFDMIDAMEFESLNEVHNTYPQFDHVKVWQAPETGTITISGNAILRNKNVVNNIPVSIYPNGYDNVVKVSIEAGDLETSEADVIHYQNNGQPVMLTTVDYLQPISSNYNVTKGEFIFFRIHNEQYGSGAEVEWNPVIAYNYSSGLDENGKNMQSFSAKDDFLITYGKSINAGKGVYSNCTVNFNLPTLTTQFTDDVKLVVKVTGYTDTSSFTDTYVRTYTTNNLWVSSGSTETITLSQNHDYFIEFYVESDSNIAWNEINWKPSYYFNNNSGQAKFPPVEYKIYNHNINDSEYWVNNNELIQPNMQTGNNNAPFIVASHNFFNTWENVEDDLPSSSTFAFPIKVSWVVKAKTSAGDELIDKRVFYIHYDNQAYEYFFTSTESVNTVINPVFYDYYSSINISKNQVNDIYNTGGRIFSAFYVDNKEIADDNPTDITFSLDDLQTGSFSPIVLDKPFFISKPTFYGLPYRGWGQFLYNGGIKVEYVDGEATDEIDVNYADTGIDVTLFDYESQYNNGNYNMDSNNVPDPTPVRYLFYSQDLENEVYNSSALYNNSQDQVKAQYGYNDESELTAKIGRFGESNLFDMYVDPETIAEVSTDQTFVALRQYSKSKGSAESVNAAGAIGGVAGGGSVTYSEANSTVMNMYVDLNGDRYPDIVTKDHVQYTNMLGGLVDGSVSTNFSVGDSSEDETYGITISGIVPNSTGEGADANKTTVNINSGITSGNGTSYNTNQYLDINGDGLPDRISISGGAINVKLNLGYTFTDSFIWQDFSNISTISSRNCVSFSPSGGFSGGIDAGGQTTVNASFALGIGGAQSTANMKVLFSDVNGDGLPDLLKEENGNYIYYLNAGDHFITNNFNAPNIFHTGNSIERDYTLALNAFGSLTLGVTFPLIPTPIFIKITGTGSGSVNASFNEKRITIQDWNGDGYIDVLEKNDYNDKLRIRLNNTDKTHLLKKVNTPLGGSWEVTYKRDGNTYNMPQSKWIVNSITTNDGFATDADYKPNTTKTEVTYSRPNYDRREREFLGYGSVIIKQLDPVTLQPYRSVAKTYLNSNYYLSGVETENQVSDANGIISESFTLFNLLNPDSPQVNMAANEEGNYLQQSLISNADDLLDKSRLFLVPVRVTSKTYENGAVLTSVKEFTQYSNSGNLTEFIDYGEGGDDAYKTNLVYYSTAESSPLQSLQNPIGYVKRIRVWKLNSNVLLRDRYVGYNSTGKLALLRIYFSSSSDFSSTRFYYDTFGNMNHIKFYDNLNTTGSAYYTKDFNYDNKLNTYPVQLLNAFGESSSAEYNYLFGIPTLVTDMNGEKMRTKIDAKGRVTEVTGPNEMALEQTTGTNTAWTIRMEYENSFVPGTSNPGQHHAVTRHFDSEYAAETTPNVTTNEILTVSIIDGLGQPIQVKKTHFSNELKWLVSGFEKKDAYGRVIASYLPVTQPYNSGNSPNYYYVPVSSLTDDPVEMTYDSKDRVRTVKQPGETDVSSIDYVISDGMLLQKVTNPNGDETTQTFDTYTDIRGRQRKTVQNGTKTIVYDYNCINELLKVTDENSETGYTYDFAGRLTEVRQPDRGIVRYKYDKANRLTEMITSNLALNNQSIKYHYNYGRLVRIEYPQVPQNEVKYTYGEPNDPLAIAENAVGRLLKQEDASGVQVFGYGRMGEVTKNLRSVAVAGHHSFWFLTEWKYDSWNRIKEIIYPDREKVTYRYNTGGMVYKLENDIPAITTPQNIIDNIMYNDYGERVSITHGNGTTTTYNYDARRRMDNLQHTFANNYQVSREYTYDVLSNITKIETAQPQNSLPGQGHLGGPVYHEYTYDNFNRLTHAKGHYTGANDTGDYLRQEYELTMEYNTDHTIKKKSQVQYRGVVQALGPLDPAERFAVPRNSYVLDYSEYATADFVAGNYGYAQQHAPRKIVETPSWVNNPSADDPRIREKTIDYDANGNQKEIKEKVGELQISLRKNLWDEENRLIGVDLKPDDKENQQDHPVAIYTYDAGGERIIKYNYNRTDVFTNADKKGENTTENIMIYPSGLIMGKVNIIDTLRSGRLLYTKHYYIGSERVSAKNGTGNGVTGYNTSILGNTMPSLTEGFVRPASNTSVQDAGTMVTNIHNVFGVTPPPLNTDFSHEDGLQLHHGNIPLHMYYFHPDHLGSSSYITNKTGVVCQHMEYLPFGETLADEHLNSINSPFKYNGKEFDEETGNYYYSARYYDPKFSIFISVDPLVDQTRDAYGYCVNNPIVYIDPDGKDIYRYDEKTGKLILFQQTEDAKDVIGKFKLNEDTGKYEMDGELVSGIAKGILHDGINFKNEANIIEINGDGKPTEQQVKDFLVDLGDYIAKAEVSGYGVGKLDEKILGILVEPYKDNDYDSSVSIPINKNYPVDRFYKNFKPSDVKDRWFTKYHFHTHPQYAPDYANPSEDDIRISRNKNIEHRIFYTDKFNTKRENIYKRYKP